MAGHCRKYVHRSARVVVRHAASFYGVFTVNRHEINVENRDVRHRGKIHHQTEEPTDATAGASKDTVEEDNLWLDIARGNPSDD